MLFCDEILPPKTVTFFKVKMMIIINIINEHLLPQIFKENIEYEYTLTDRILFPTAIDNFSVIFRWGFSFSFSLFRRSYSDSAAGAGATCFEVDWLNWRPSTGGAASPGGSTIPRWK
jgi:hypothetical protein